MSKFRDSSSSSSSKSTKKQQVPNIVIDTPSNTEELFKLIGGTPRQDSPKSILNSPKINNSLNNSDEPQKSPKRAMLINSGADIRIIRSPKTISPDYLRKTLKSDFDKKVNDLNDYKRMLDRAYDNCKILERDVAMKQLSLKRSENKLNFFNILCQCDSSDKDTFIIITKNRKFDDTLERHDLVDIVEKMGKSIIVQDAKMIIDIASEKRIKKEQLLTQVETERIGWKCKDTIPKIVLVEDDSPRDKSPRHVPKYEDCYESLFASELDETDFQVDLSTISACDEDTFDGTVRALATAGADIFLVTVKKMNSSI